MHVQEAWHNELQKKLLWSDIYKVCKRNLRRTQRKAVLTSYSPLALCSLLMTVFQRRKCCKASQSDSRNSKIKGSTFYLLDKKKVLPKYNAIVNQKGVHKKNKNMVCIIRPHKKKSKKWQVNKQETVAAIHYSTESQKIIANKYIVGL